MPALCPAVAGYRLAVGHTGRLGRRLDSVLSLELLEDHVEVNVAEPRNDELLGLLHPLDMKRRVLFGQACQATGNFLLVAAGLGGDGEAVGRGRQVQRCEWSSVLGRTHGVPGQRVGELGHGADVAGVDLGRGHVVLASRVEDLREALVTAPVQVGQVLVGLDRAGDDLEVADPPELVTAGAEHEGPGRLVWLALGRRQELRDRRHQGPHAKKLRGRRAHDRGHLAREDSFAQAALDLLLIERARVEVLLEQRVVALGGGFDELAAVLLDELLHVVRNRCLGALAVGRRHECLQVEQVDDASEILLGADREVKRERPRRQVLAHSAHGAVEVGMLLVELVYHHHPRLARSVAELPGDLGADGQVRVRTYHHHRPFRRAEAAEGLTGEIEKAWSVEDVDLEPAVLRESHSEVDRDLAPLFFGLEVHGRRLLIGRAKARYGAGAEQHRLGQGRFAIVRVAQQDHVPDLFGRVIGCHPTPS